MKVFIADDSPSVVTGLADLLGDFPGLELVGHAGNVAEATDSICELHPDAVILDMQMPGGSGLDVLRAIKISHPDTIVIVCTNFPSPQMFQQCRENGANFCLDKSMEFDRIPAILDSLMRKPASI